MKSLCKIFLYSAYLMAATPVHATVLAVKDNTAQLLKEASKTAAILVTLKKGDEVEAVERKGMFWRVKYNKYEGYISVTAMKRAPAGASSLSQAIRAAAEQSRTTDEVQGSRARSAVMGVRGLSSSDDVAGAGNASPNSNIIYSMEDRQISEAKIEELGRLVSGEIERRSTKK